MRTEMTQTHSGGSPAAKQMLRSELYPRSPRGRRDSGAAVPAGKLLAAAFIAALALIYVNFIPFEYRAVPFDLAVENFRNLHWLNFNLYDRARWVSNIMQFVPLGFCVCGALSRRHALIGIVVAGVLGTSLAVG